MLTGRLPFQVGGNMPRHVSFNGIVSKDALRVFAAAVHPFTSASIEHGEVIEMFDIDFPEQAGGAYHSVKFLLVVHVRDNAGIRHSFAIPAPKSEYLEIKRQMWTLKTEPGQLITQAYAQLTGLEDLTFDQGALVG